MTVPTHAYFSAYTHPQAGEGALLVTYIDRWTLERAVPSRTPFDATTGEPLPYSHVVNRPFEAVIYFVGEDVSGKGIVVRRLDTPLFYMILTVDLIKVFNEGEIVNGLVRGIWQVESRRKGHGLKLVEALPWTGLDEKNSSFAS